MPAYDWRKLFLGIDITYTPGGPSVVQPLHNLAIYYVSVDERVMAPKKRKVTKQVLQRLLNAAQSFRDLSDVPTEALATTFESEAAARAALMDATLHEAHQAFMAPIATRSGHDPTLHAVDLGRQAPGIVAATSGSAVQVFSQTAHADKPGEPNMAAKPPRSVKRRGCLRAVTSAAKLEEKRADAAVERRERPKRPREPKSANTAPPAQPAQQPLGEAAGVAPAPPQVVASLPTDPTNCTAVPQSVPQDPPAAAGAAAAGAVAGAPAEKKRRAKPAAPPVETMTTVTAQTLATEHDLFECPASWVQQLRVLSGEDTILKQAMSDALIKGTPSDAIQLVVGPPGTGKSVELIHRTSAAVQAGATRVLLTAPTNLAATDLYCRLRHTCPEINPVLAMREERVVGPLSEVEAAGRHDPESPEVEAADVVVATAATVTLAAMRRGRPFSHILVDEAGLLPEAACWCLLRGMTQELTLCGDPAQLESMVSEAGRPLGFGRSLFRRLLDLGYPAKSLHVQRRMHPQIAGLTVDRFYGGHVSTEYTEPGWKNLDKLLGVTAVVSEGHETQVGTSWKNDWEATRACIIAEELKSRLPPGSSIVILVPYSAQAERLKDSPVEVATVDSFQGREADAVVLCMVRDRRSGFWVDDGRLCVALTRARHHLTVLAGAGWEPFES